MVIGIDTSSNKGHAVAQLSPGGSVIADKRQLEDLRWLAEDHPDAKWFIEKPIGYLSHTSTMMKLSQAYGEVIGFLKAFDIEPVPVNPKTWQSKVLAEYKNWTPPEWMPRGLREKKSKAASVARVVSEYGGELITGPRGGIDDDLADAINIAYFGQVHHGS